MVLNKLLRLPIAAGLSLGVAAGAQASVYAVSYNNITNLSVTSTDAAGENGPVFVPLEARYQYRVTSEVSATKNGTQDPANPTNSFSSGGPVDTAPTFGSDSMFSGGAPGNNDMTPLGELGEYSRADSQVSRTQFFQASSGSPITFAGDETTQSWIVAETYIPADGSAASLGRTAFETGLNTTVVLSEPSVIEINFDADPYMRVAMSSSAAGGTANANMDVTFTVTADSSGIPVFSWSPNGLVGAIFNGVESRDDVNLNASIETTSPGTSAVFDPTADNSAGTINPGIVSSFSAKTNVLPAGIYTLGLDMVDNVNVIVAEQSTASLGDRVWEDANANGIQDCTDNGDGVLGGPGDIGPECDAGIPAVTVILLSNPDGDANCSSGDEVVSATTATDLQGFYEFTDLDTDLEYCVRFDQPSANDQLLCNDIVNPGIGAQFSPANQPGDNAADSDANVATGQTTNISLSPGDNDLTWDAGLYCPSKIGDVLINDLNRNGVQDAGEPGVDGQTVQLVKCESGVPGADVIDSRITEDGGMYMFNPLPPGEYAVIFSNPGDTVFSPKDVPGDDTRDCDTDVNGATSCVTLVANEYNDTVDACVNTPPAGLGDFVFEDTNVNGVQDTAEPGIEGVTVNLLVPGADGVCNTDDDAQIGSTVTNAGGGYQFNDLDPGTYCVEFALDSVPDDFCSTDGYPLGAPLFTVQNSGDDADDSDADRATGKTGNIVLIADQFDPTNDAGIYCPAKIGDRVFEDSNNNGLQDADENGVADVEVQLFACGPDGVAGTADDVDTGERRFTDASDGMYMFGAEPGVFDLAPGSYYAKFVKPFGAEFSATDVGANDAIDSDCFPNGNSACVAVGSRGINLTRDCGVVPPPPVKCDLVIDKTCEVFAPPPPTFDKCSGKLQQFSVEWTGGDVNVSGPANDAPGGAVTAGQVVTFFGPFDQNDVFVNITGGESGQSKFHMSCSDDDFNSPDDCGKLAGNGKSDDAGFINIWKLRGFIDADAQVLDCGGPASDFPTANACTIAPPTGAGCDALGKPSSMTFRYTGQGCSASDNDQSTSEAICTGDVNGLLSVDIVAGDLDLNDLYTATPSTVGPGELFTLTTTQKVDSKSRISITNSGGTESNRLHTSCSQPLEIGDVFGSLELVGFNGATGGTEVTYGYEVTNNGDPLTGVTITDNLLGAIAGPFSLINGQTQRFTKSASLSGTTTNIANASGTLSNLDNCAAPADQVTVELVVPPVPPAVSAASSLELDDDKVKWELTNSSDEDVYVTRVVVTWPSQHGMVKKFKLEGDFAKDVFDPTSATAVPDDKAFESDENKRKLKKNDDKKLEIEFTEKYKENSQDDYTITVEFDNGQVLSFP